MRFNRNASLVLCAFLIATGVYPSPVRGQAREESSRVFIDASKPQEPPEPLSFVTGGTSPDGHSLAANTRYLTLDGKPWFPVIGEFHFSRYAEASWEEEILKMKAAGIQVISTYIFWIHHEEIEGEFDWSGQRDLRRFVELCKKHGMYVWIRIGPWAHGEVRNGGLPDWLLSRDPVRQNDEGYLQYVRRFFGEISRQVDGLFWRSGGPIVGIQIENEYKSRGPGKGADHMLALLGLAREAGLNAPFYTATAWDDAVVPAKDFLPVFNGYAEQFWSRQIDELPPNPNYFFTKIRCEENVGDDLRSKRPDLDARYASYPFLTAEMGGGMELSYHRRPLMSADDTAAMAVVKLGSGVTMYGYYMFHGGTNPDGKKTTLQESQATGYPNDLPVKSYDFQAPFGEFGQVNESLGDLKALHLFLHDFGSDLATMSPYFPKQMPKSKADIKTPRLIARMNGNSGYLFINNYQRNHPLPARKGLRVRLKLPAGEIEVPRRPVDVPSGAYTIWPVNLNVGGAVLKYATAQLLCRLEQPDTYVFFDWPGIAPQLAIETIDGETVEAPRARVKREHGVLYIDGIQPSEEVAVRIRTREGSETQIIVLSRDVARTVWKVRVGDRDHLILTAADVFLDGAHLHLRDSDPRHLNFGIFPPTDEPPNGFTRGPHKGVFDVYETSVAAVNITPEVKRLKDAGLRPPVDMGKEVAEAPKEEAYEGAAQWSIRIPAIEAASVNDVFLRITYEGDVGRIYEHDKLITDDFFKGYPWEVGLRQILEREPDPELRLSILPLRKDAPIYLPTGKRPVFPVSGQVARVVNVQVVPIYEAVADLKP